MAAIIYSIFFLSGAAALIFEATWFRLAGLALGNTVWAAALVLSGFMGGLALGNALVARHGARIGAPVKLYALLEVVIGLTGFSLIVLLPLLAHWFTPLFQPLLELPWLLNPLRLLIAFALMLVPTTAMGATLPLLVKALSRGNPNFGSVLGHLYGWNTLGAVFGVLAAELVLIRYLGLRGAGLCAAFLNLSAMFVALRVARSGAAAAAERSGDHAPAGLGLASLSTEGKRLLCAAALAGAIMLALEVVWFRFLLLFDYGSSLAFAFMLAIVLVGIGGGGLLAARWCRSSVRAHDFLRPLTLLAGVCTVLTYWLFDWVYYLAVQAIGEASMLTFVAHSVFLMLPVSLISGVLFTLLGRAAKVAIDTETRTAGLLTLANTLGAMLGALFAGFVLLPRAGMEISFFALAVAYGLAAIVIPGRPGTAPRWLRYSAVAAFVLCVCLFPFGYMNRTIFAITDLKYPDAERVALREGLTETAVYYRYDRFGKPFFYRLATNGFSMSGTKERAQRYMKLYVYWPVALHPNPKSALLISYGVGSTAKALTDTRQLQSIDVVDISRSILDLSAIVFPGPNEHPLHDERVRVHIEDGRFFLQTTDRRFDLIPSEPPPPKIAGVVNLYTREYFELIRARLAEGGMATYWLPVFQLDENDTLSVIKGFCDAFADCSLWAGSGLDWMLIGTRNATGPVSEEHFQRQWKDPVVGPRLRALGLEQPAQLGALFMADAAGLKQLTQDALPLTDNFPGRLSRYEISSSPAEPLYAAMMDAGRAREAFAHSTFIAGLWPPGLRTASLEFFDYQRMITLRFAPKYRIDKEYVWDELHRTLTQTSLRTLPLWLVRSSQREQDIVSEVGNESALDRDMELTRAHGAIARRDYERAIEHFHAAIELQPPNRMFPEHRLYRYVLAVAGRLEEAVRFGEKMFKAAPVNPAERRYRRWMQRTFGPANPVAQSAHGHLVTGAAPARPATGRSELP